MKKELPKINFDNQDNPNSYFEILKIEDLFNRDLDHNITKNHLVKFYIIMIVYEGQGQHTIDFTDYDLKKGTVLLIKKDQVQKFSKNSSIKGLLLIFTEEFIISHLNKMEALRSMQLFNDSLSFPKIAFENSEDFSDFTILLKHLEAEYKLNDSFSVGITRSVLHIVITKLFRIKSKQGHFVERKKYMTQFLAFQEMVEEDCFSNKMVLYYARKLGVTTKTLNNIVQSIINESSAKTFIDERTIMQIKRLLISTEHSIKEIAYISGFSDSTNFYKYFKKLAGTSPEVFRQAH
jgi:AraC family transcriptional regulator, transcriptional activator of pobA